MKIEINSIEIIQQDLAAVMQAELVPLEAGEIGVVVGAPDVDNVPPADPP